MGIMLHNVPKNGATGDPYQGLGTDFGVFGKPCAHTTTKDHDGNVLFHISISFCKLRARSIERSAKSGE
jgi:hypothetical protein